MMRRGFMLMMVMVLLVTACGDDGLTTEATDGATTVTTGTVGDSTETTEAASLTTQDTMPSGAPFIMQGENSAFVGALQSYLECAGYGPLAIDGMFGQGTAAAVEQAQTDLNKAASGEPDEDTFAWLARACSDPRTIEFASGAITAEVAGNAAPGDDELLGIGIVAGQQATVLIEGAVDIGIQGADGSVLHRPDGSAEIIVDIPVSQSYTLRVSADAPTSYALTITIPALETTTTTLVDATGFLLAVDGFNEIDFGVESGEALDYLIDRFGPPVEDTDWIQIDPSEYPPERSCATVHRTVTWEFAATADHAATTLDVLFHDWGYSNPAFASWNYRLTNHEDRDQHGPGVLHTPHGLSVGESYNKAVSLGFELGGYEEMSHGQIDWIDAWVYNPDDGYDPSDYEAEGWVGSMRAGAGYCEDPF